MKIIHKANERGHIDHGWLNTYHSFSFANYLDRYKMNFGKLRVLNDDYVMPGKGFGMHPHDNMEIVTVILEGSLKHVDSMGNEGVIKKNEIQAMSAGSGIMHSEFNPSENEICNLLQIWIMPKELNIKPRYEQKIFIEENKQNNFMTLVSPEKSENSMFINQNAWFSIAKIEKDVDIEYQLKNPDNGVYIFIIEGDIKIAEDRLGKRDAIGLSEIDIVNIKAVNESEVLVIEVPMN